MKEEAELLQLQEEVDLEVWNGTGIIAEEAPSHSAYVRNLINTAAEEYTEDTTVMNLGPAKPAPIVAMPCSCSEPEECCMEARMLALQDILEDERRAGPDFISFASSINAEVTREIKDTVHLISRFDKDRELKIEAHRAAIRKIWWIPYHKRPDHPTPYHRNSPLPTPIPGPSDFNPHAPVFLPSEERERPNKRKRAQDICKCPECRKRRMRRTVRTQTQESALVWSNQDPDPTTCLFQAHQQAHKDLVNTFVCCNAPAARDELRRTGLPPTRQEAWRFTSLAPLIAVPPQVLPVPELLGPKPDHPPASGALRLYWDGDRDPLAGMDLPEGLSRLETGLQDSLLGTVLEVAGTTGSWLVRFNTALAGQVLALRVRGNVAVPLELVSDCGQGSGVRPLRLLLVMEEDASLD
jgi:hypothetical protein